MNRWLTTIRRWIRKCGWDVVRYNAQTNINVRRQMFLEKLGIECVLDVGANVGDYADTLRQFGYRGEIVSVEPTSDAFATLEARSARDPRWSAKRLAVAGASGERTIFVAANSVSSSLLERSARMVGIAPESRYVRQEVVATTTLDSLVSEAALPVFAKLDVQGSAGEILAAANGSLRRLSALEIELPFVEMYQGERLSLQLLGGLQDAGFELVSLEANTFDRSSGAVQEINAIVARSDRGSAR
jgi:FkbM family methyltransferase